MSGEVGVSLGGVVSGTTPAPSHVGHMRVPSLENVARKGSVLFPWQVGQVAMMAPVVNLGAWNVAIFECFVNRSMPSGIL